jgi:hypothetical protein
MSHGQHTPGDPEDGKQAGGHGKHGMLLMAACCIPMVLIFVLIGLKVL